MTTKVIRENTRKRFTEVAVAVEEIGNSMTLTLKALAEGKHIKVLNSVYITGLQISVTSVNPTKLLTVEIVSSI